MFCLSYSENVDNLFLENTWVPEPFDTNYTACTVLNLITKVTHYPLFDLLVRDHRSATMLLKYIFLHINNFKS